MARYIKVNILGRGGMESRMLSPEETEAVINEAYNDPLGGLVTDALTGQLITQIGPETREINISEIMGGG